MGFSIRWLVQICVLDSRTDQLKRHTTFKNHRLYTTTAQLKTLNRWTQDQHPALERFHHYELRRRPLPYRPTKKPGSLSDSWHFPRWKQTAVTTFTRLASLQLGCCTEFVLSVATSRNSSNVGKTRITIPQNTKNINHSQKGGLWHCFTHSIEYLEISDILG